ncbi:MAG: hypothetical protein GXY07_05300 [Candidatus Hydrogenedentes bacterium]|nr:hypothetical protein [Candidatus Hydrogenedentota bacterium]
MEIATEYAGKEVCIERSGGTLVRRKGIYIVHLRGDYEAMGRQHGELAAAVCGAVVPLYMNDLVHKLVAHAVPTFSAPIAATLKGLFHWRNRGELGEELHAHLGALAQALGFAPVLAERLFTVPDIFHYLAGRSFAVLAPPPSCTAFFACGEATLDGKLLIGRNFDFFGRGVWNSNNAVIVMHPDNGQCFCWLGALGVPASGQGLNESGLFVGLHSKFTRDVSTKGAPIFSIVHDVLAHCSSLDEAVTRITARPRLCGLSLFVVDTKARTAAAVGFSARHAEVVPAEEDVLVRANHYTTPEMQRFEAGPHPWRNNSYGRFQRLVELLEEKRGVLTAEAVPAMLSDCTDPFEGRKRVIGDTLAALHNAQSIVVSPDDDTLWIARGDYPVCHAGRFNGFRLSALWEDSAERCDMPDLPGGGHLNESEQFALYEYEQAWSAYMDHLNTSDAIFHLLRAGEHQPGEPIFPRMAGLLLLKEKKFALALPLLLKNTEHDYRSPVMRAEAHVWAGRCLDLLGRREEAVSQYKTAAAINAFPVSQAAARHCVKPFRKWSLASVSPEFLVGTALAKY